MILKALLIFSVLLAVSASPNECQALYWEVNSSYVLDAKELNHVAEVGVSPPNIEDDTGIILNKTHYTISNIEGAITYDSSKEDSKKQGNSYVVKNAILNILFTFNLTAGKKYSGNGTAKIDGITVGYTKTPGITNISAGFKISSVSVFVPAVVPNKDFKPTPSSADETEFNRLLTVNLTNYMKDYFNSSLQQLLFDAANHDGIPNPFGKQIYNYTYNNNRKNGTVQMNTTAIYQQVFDVGYLIGYDGTLNGKGSICSEYKPSDFTKQSSFFSKQFIDNFYKEFRSIFEGWTNYVVDSGNARTSYFGFRIADLEPIVPSVTLSYPNLLDKIEARCTIDKDLDNQLNLNTETNSVDIQAGWTCGIFKVESQSAILNFYVINQYSFSVNQTDSQLNIQIQSATPKSCNWQAADFPIANEALASLYLTIIVATFNQQYTVGTGFVQPKRTYPKVTIWKDAVQVYDAGGSTEIEV